MNITKINSNFFMNNLNNKSSNNCSTEAISNNTDLRYMPYSVPFKGGKMLVAKATKMPNLMQANNIEVFEKISSYVRRFPREAKNLRPILFAVGGVHYGITLDKTNNVGCRLVVKDKINTPDDWAHPIQSQTVMSCLLDENGVMQSGELIKRRNDNFSKRVEFFRDNRGHKRIRTEGTIYRMSKETPEEWNYAPDISTNPGQKLCNFKKELKNLEFSEVFMELTKDGVVIADKI